MRSRFSDYDSIDDDIAKCQGPQSDEQNSIKALRSKILIGIFFMTIIGSIGFLPKRATYGTLTLRNDGLNRISNADGTVKSLIHSTNEILSKPLAPADTKDSNISKEKDKDSDQADYAASDRKDSTTKKDTTKATTTSVKSNSENAANIKNTNTSWSSSASTYIPMPSGVNFGSWLALEDYFYVGSSGAVEVATPDDNIAAVCLPPLHTGRGGPEWQSETDLLASLTKQVGLPKALKVFHAHRTSYIDFETDLLTLQKLGIKNIRVPISWCLTDYDPSFMLNYTAQTTNETLHSIQQKYTCADPFYEGVYWPAIPKALIVTFLRSCAMFGLKVMLDIHTYPGATSIGTFSGLWPRWPKFWTDGDKPEDATIDIGRPLYQSIIKWVESLATTDPKAFDGLRGISSMNEPAHLAGLFGPGATAHPKKKSFLPNLPPKIARAFLQQLNDPSKRVGRNLSIPILDGPHLRTLLWLSDSVDIFRKSKLPSLGKELHVNIHESVFHPTVIPSKNPDNTTNDAAPFEVIGSWWNAITTPTERSSWCILDIHHYHAWDSTCQGSVDGSPLGAYMCSDSIQRTKVLEKCALWATAIYRKTIDATCGIGTKLVSAEFSASTHHSVRHACSDIPTLSESYQTQVKAAAEANIELFWWSYKMPYGGAFRPAWSFKHFLYLMGILDRPDESIHDCGQHIPTKKEPIDPIFEQ